MSNVEIRTVELTENMVRAIAKQAEAERDRRAKIIHAKAEFQASQTLVKRRANPLEHSSRQTLTEIGAEQNSTIVFPMPITSSSLFSRFLTKEVDAELAEPDCSRRRLSVDGGMPTASIHIREEAWSEIIFRELFDAIYCPMNWRPSNRESNEAL